MKKTFRKTDKEGDTGLGFQYYLEQLHQMSDDQESSPKTSIEQSDGLPAEEPIDEKQLVFFVKLLKMCAETGDAYLEDVMEHLDDDPQYTYQSLKRMQGAGILDISEGKVKLTQSGRDLLHDL